MEKACSLRYPKAEPTLSTNEGREASLTGQALIEILQAVLNKNMPFRFRATGYSMFPFIFNGDVVTISPLSNIAPRIGDVVAIIHPESEKLAVHRVVGKKGNYFLIKGDNLVDADGFVPMAKVLGRISKVERNGKKISFGLGPERILIAFLARKRRVYPFVNPIWKLARPILRKLTHG